MNPFCKPAEHRGRRAFLKGTLTTASGLAVANWGGLFNSQTIAAEVRKQGKHCILLWTASGAGRHGHLRHETRPARKDHSAVTRVPGIQVLKVFSIAQQADKLAIIPQHENSPGRPSGH